MRTKLRDGYEVDVNENALNDWKYITMLRNITKGDYGLIVDVAEMILGSDGVENLAKHLEVDGYTPADKMIESISEILESVGELKN